MVRHAAVAIATTVIAVAVLLGVGVTRAGASSLAPTDWRSTLVSVAPTSDTVRVEVFEGGEAIRVVVAPGHTLTVPGYSEEPYLRVTADGTVEANTNSPTWWANRSSTGRVSMLDAVDATTAPDWRRIGSGGAVTWHDHRIHAMPGTTGDTDWTVTFAVDGLPHVARGRLAHLPSHSPAAEALVVVVVAALTFLVGRPRARTAVPIAIVTGTAIATTLAIGEALSTPAGMDTPTSHVVITAVSLVLAVAATIVGRRARRTATVLLVASVAAVSWWWVLLLPAMTAAIVPNAFADPVARVGLAVAAGAVLAGAALLVSTGGFATGTTTAGDQSESAPVA